MYRPHVFASLFIALGACADERSQDVRPVACNPAVDPTCVRLHDPGILEEKSPNFHGALIARSGYDFSLCASCHGVRFDGGPSGFSCRKCHEDGPKSCSVCHEKTQSSGAHAAHLPLDRAYDGCATCHQRPADVRAPGHVLVNGVIDPSPVEVTIAGWDAAEKRCSNDCHTLGDPAATDPRPRWDTPREPSCDRCHGLPPADHARNEACSSCHGRVVGADNTILQADLHLDGEVDLGTGDGSCEGCHQENDRGHRAHLIAPRRLSAPFDCSACHEKPSSITAPGHLDSPAPVEVMEAWNSESRTCTDSYCHGAGETPIWGAVEATIACGDCHGIPPQDEEHSPDLSIQACSGCHPSVDAYGVPQADLHLDGKVDR